MGTSSKSVNYRSLEDGTNVINKSISVNRMDRHEVMINNERSYEISRGKCIITFIFVFFISAVIYANVFS